MKGKVEVLTPRISRFLITLASKATVPILKYSWQHDVLFRIINLFTQLGWNRTTAVRKSTPSTTSILRGGTELLIQNREIWSEKLLLRRNAPRLGVRHKKLEVDDSGCLSQKRSLKNRRLLFLIQSIFRLIRHNIVEHDRNCNIRHKLSLLNVIERLLKRELKALKKHHWM